TAQNDGLAVAKIYEYLQKHRQNKIALLTVSDGFGASGREQLKSLAGKYGMQVVVDDTYGPKDTDMTSQLTKIRGSQAQVLIVWGTNPGPAVIAKNAKQLGLKLPLYMSHGVSSKKFIALAGDAAEGVRLPSGKVIVSDVLPKSDPQKGSLLTYVKDYQKHFKAEGDHFGGHAWDGVMLVKAAIEKGGATTEGIRTGLESLKDFHGIGGTFNFSAHDHAGLNKDAFIMVEVKNKDWMIAK
ncbi:MAG: ABC transporter substrate-binding protein, partial [Geobacter sp.]|nr:ABC transporter substrate-binding protein [Geobacter sp.]